MRIALMPDIKDNLILWEIKDQKDYQKLDEYEDYPDLYTKYTANVECGGKTYNAVVYEMTNETKQKLSNVKYSDEYRRECHKAAISNDIPSVFN